MAANINLNAKKIIEFGQGSSGYVTCAGSSALKITPISAFTNNSGLNGSFSLSGFQVSGIPTGCSGSQFLLNVYDSSTSSPIAIYNSTSADVLIYDQSGVFSTDGSSGVTVNTNSNTTFTVTFAIPVAVAANSAKFTIQSSIGAPALPGSIYLNVASLSTPYSSILDVGSTGAFTLEMWAKPTSNAVVQGLYTGGSFGGQMGFFDSGCGASDKLFVGTWGQSCNFLSNSGTYPILNQWNHVVLQRDGSNNNSVYLNGSRIIYSSGSVQLGLHGANALTIGAIERGNFTGYISTFRLVTGSALYSGASITVPTSALTTTPGSGTVRSLLLMKSDSKLFADETGAQTYSSTQTRTQTPSATTGTYSYSSDGPFN